MSKALLTASLLLATLLLGAPQATAAQPSSPNILTPADPPVPQPCEARWASCDITAPTLETDSPTTDPPAPPSPAGTATSTDPVAGSTTPAGQTNPDEASWWLVAVPVLALLALAAAGAFLAIQRTERRPQ